MMSVVVELKISMALLVHCTTEETAAGNLLTAKYSEVKCNDFASSVITLPSSYFVCFHAAYIVCAMVLFGITIRAVTLTTPWHISADITLAV